MATNCKVYMKEYRAKNKERIAAQVKAYQTDNEAYKAYRKEHWATRDEATQLKKTEANRQWKADNKGLVNASTARRRAAKLERTPAWLTKDDHDAINAMYAFAAKLGALTGLTYHVDHIIPLRGETISGLHVPQNLQVMVSSLNESKGNRYDSI